jgi:dTDP-4-amino-4,6-dideoxygalactose transaminase
MVGGNFRLDTLQAAVVKAKLPHLDDWTAGRRLNAQRYDRLFAGSGLVEKNFVTLPQARAGRHIFNQYVIRVPRRDELQNYLKAQEVGTEVYYPVPMHLQECFKYLGYKAGDFPESEKACTQTLAIPVYPDLTKEQLDYIADYIIGFLK